MAGATGGALSSSALIITRTPDSNGFVMVIKGERALSVHIIFNDRTLYTVLASETGPGSLETMKTGTALMVITVKPCRDVSIHRKSASEAREKRAGSAA